MIHLQTGWFYYIQFVIWIMGIILGWIIREIAFKHFGHDFDRQDKKTKKRTRQKT